VGEGEQTTLGSRHRPATSVWRDAAKFRGRCRVVDVQWGPGRSKTCASAPYGSRACPVHARWRSRRCRDTRNRRPCGRLSIIAGIGHARDGVADVQSASVQTIVHHGDRHARILAGRTPAWAPGPRSGSERPQSESRAEPHSSRAGAPSVRRPTGGKAARSRWRRRNTPPGPVPRERPGRPRRERISR
jgi:hypothetical protein